MRIRHFMAASAAFLFLLGLGATFAPHELLAHFRAEPRPGLLLLIQAAGALYLGFAMLNWMAKGGMRGGIYGRPVSIGNLVHFTIMSFALARVVLDGVAPPMLVVITLVYAAFAVGFALVAFRPGGFHSE